MQRLKTRPQFQAVLAGNIVARTAHFALHCNRFHLQTSQADLEKSTVNGFVAPMLLSSVLFPSQSVWIGAMVPKRWARRAVTRNTIKRQIYIVSAGFLNNYPQAAFVVRLRKEFSRKEFFSATSDFLREAVRAEIVTLMQAGIGLK